MSVVDPHRKKQIAKLDRLLRNTLDKDQISAGGDRKHDRHALFDREIGERHRDHARHNRPDKQWILPTQC